MCASDRLRRTLLLLLLTLSGSCDDPGAFLVPPEVPGELVVVAALDPGSAFQTVYVQTLGGGLLPRPVVGRILRDGVVVAEETIDEDAGGNLGACVAGFGAWISGGGVCFQLSLWPEVGGEYELEVEAPGRKQVRARTTVVETVDLGVAALAGEPPEHVNASWSASAGTHRYFLSVRSAEVRCVPCATGWATYLDSIRYDGPVDAASLEEGAPPWLVEVQAMNRELYEFLTTGATGNLFTVPPRQNVLDGHGVFGSRARSQVEGGRPVSGLRRGPWDLRSLPAPDLRALRIDPSTPEVLWVAGPAEVLRSADAGSTWTTELEGPDLVGASLSVGPDGTVLIGRGNDLLWRDPASGAWTVATTFQEPVRVILQVSGGAWVVTAETPGAAMFVHRVEPAGGPVLPTGPWQRVGSVDAAPRSSRDRVRFVRDPGSGTLWLGLREGGVPLFRSDDDGETWERLALPTGLMEDLVALPGGHLYTGSRGSSDGIYVSGDGGRAWTRPAEIPTAAIAAHPERPDQVWMAEQPLPEDGADRPRLRVLVSTAAGADPEPTGFVGGDPRDLAVDPTGTWVYLLVGVSSFDLPGTLSTTAVLRLPAR